MWRHVNFDTDDGFFLQNMFPNKFREKSWSMGGNEIEVLEIPSMISLWYLADPLDSPAPHTSSKL